MLARQGIIFVALRRLAVLRAQRLIVAGFGAKRDRQAIPGVDRGDRHHQIYKLSIAELSVRLVLDAIRNVIDAD